MATSYCLWCLEENEGDGPCPSCGRENSALSPEPHHLPPGTILRARYLVGRALGEGGFGITYIGCDLTLGRKVAIKEYFPIGYATRSGVYATTVTRTSSSDVFESGLARFLKEARTMAKFGGGTLVGVSDYFEENGTAYIVMDYIEGQSLAEVCEERGGRIPAPELLAMIRPVFGALGMLHKAHLVHRDVSPDNIMVSSSGARLIDFGCARDFIGEDGDGRTMTVMLKYDYAAPEQYGRGGQGPWTDVYGICATIYRCVCGQTPPRALERFSGSRLIPPTEFGAELTPAQEAAIIHGLEPTPERRQQSIDELVAELDGALARPVEPGVARPQWTAAGAASRGSQRISTQEAAAQSEPTSTSFSTPVSATEELPVAVPAEEPGDDQQEPRSSQVDEAARDGGLAQKSKSRTAVLVGAAAAVVVLVIAIVAVLSMRPSAPTSGTTSDSSSSQTSDTASKTTSDSSSSSTSSDSSSNQTPNQTIRLNLGGQKATQYRDGAVAAGWYQTIVLCDDGTVAGTEITNADRDHGQSAVADWKDVVFVDTDEYHSVGLCKDGTVVATRVTGNDGDYGQTHIGGWKNIVSVAAGSDHTVAARSDGSVVAMGDNSDGQCDVGSWSDVVQVSCGSLHTVGLRKDGTVVATGRNSEGQCEVSDWTDIVAVSAGMVNTVGLRKDGTVIATKVLTDDVNRGQSDVSEWKNVVAISAGGRHTVAVLADGTAVATHITNESSNSGQCDVEGWKDIVSISAGGNHTVALLADGTVVSAGSNSCGQRDISSSAGGQRPQIAHVQMNSHIAAGTAHTAAVKSDGKVITSGSTKSGQNTTSTWKDVVSVAAGEVHTLGLRKDGTVVSTNISNEDEDAGQSAVTEWKNIVAIAAAQRHSVGLRADGTVVATEVTKKEEDAGQSNVSDWTDIVAVSAGSRHTVGLRADGTVVATRITSPTADIGQSNVSGWSDIVAVSAGYYHTVGLRKDGTVVATGRNSEGQCNVAQWTDIVAVSAGYVSTVGLRADGTVVTTNIWNEDRDYGQANDIISMWADVCEVHTGGCVTIALRYDGSVVACGMENVLPEQGLNLGWDEEDMG